MKIIYSHLKNIQSLIAKHNFTHFEYQLPDEYRVDVVLTNLCNSISIAHSAVDSEHFSPRVELASLKGRKLCDGKLYRMLRKKHHVLMEEIIP
jgi:deoxyribodipyrimidine photolyase-related protein